MEVVSGKPCYSRAKGLKINSKQTIASFCSKVFPNPVEAKLAVGTQDGTGASIAAASSEIRVGQAASDDLAINLMRTVRVPENRKTYDLPPGLGAFPVFNVAPF